MSPESVRRFVATAHQAFRCRAIALISTLPLAYLKSSTGHDRYAQSIRSAGMSMTPLAVVVGLL